MNKIDLELFNEESFVDDDVLIYNLDPNKKYLQVKLTGAELVSGKYLSEVEIRVYNWESLKIYRREDEHATLIKQDVNELKPDNILQFHHSNNQLKLVDVGDHCWIDWVFKNPVIEIYGKFDDE